MEKEEIFGSMFNIKKNNQARVLRVNQLNITLKTSSGDIIFQRGSDKKYLAMPNDFKVHQRLAKKQWLLRLNKTVAQINSTFR